MGVSGYTKFDGDIKFDGQSITNLTIDERAQLGITLAWQEPARYEGLTVQSFISAGAKDKNDKTVMDSLALVGLNPLKYMNRAVDKTLSGGERKRIEIASILAMHPRLLIMDEPDSGIDVDALEQIFNTLKVLKERGATVLMITHSHTVLRQAEHAFLMCDGRLLDKGSVDKISRFFEGQCMPCKHPNEPEEDETERTSS
jgi:Fe-S cluster assembly ATP-binding protein